jgi:hypothetical protein
VRAIIAAVSEKIISLASVIFGTVGGIAWSALPSTEPAKPQAVPSVAQAIPAATGVAEARSSSVYYAGCNEVRALGKAPLYDGQPGYRIEMDGDGDGIACEPHREDR